MNILILKSLASLIRLFWSKDYREIIDSLKIEMKKEEDLETFLKRLNYIGDERSIIRILNNMLLDHGFQNHCLTGLSIDNRLSDDVRSDLITMITNDGYKIENYQVKLPPPSSAYQFEKYIENLLEKLDYNVVSQVQKGTMRPDFLITEKNNPV